MESARPETDTSTASWGIPGRSTVSFNAPSSQVEATTGAAGLRRLGLKKESTRSSNLRSNVRSNGRSLKLNGRVRTSIGDLQ
jgi:hypothetical protein